MVVKKSTSVYGSIEETNHLLDLSSFTATTNEFNKRSSSNNEIAKNINSHRRHRFYNAWVTTALLLTTCIFLLSVTFLIVRGSNFQSNINSNASSTKMHMLQSDKTTVDLSSQLVTADSSSTKVDLTTRVIVVEGPATSSNNAGIMIEITLQPNEQIISDSDTLLYMTDNIQYSLERRGPTMLRLDEYGSTMLIEGKITVDVFKNIGTGPGKIGLATEFPGRILPIHLEDYDDNTIIGNEHSFLAASYDVTLDFEQQRLKGASNVNANMWYSIFGYLIRLEKISGTGTIYLSGSGNIVAKQLEEGEKLKLIDSAWVAMTNRMKMEYSTGKRNSIFALPLLEVEGPGTIWIDTAPLKRMVDLIHKMTPPKEGNDGE